MKCSCFSIPMPAGMFRALGLLLVACVLMGWSVVPIQAQDLGFTSIYSFVSDKATRPYCGVVQGRDGTLYGTTAYGGAYQNGVVYRINPDGSGYRMLYSFAGGTDGINPQTSLIQGQDGALYGTTGWGGLFNEGTLFKINPDGSGYQVVYSFLGGNDGANPQASLLQGQDGALYGAATNGGVSHKGTLFKINPDGTGFQVVYSFTGSNDGSASNDGTNPVANLIQGNDAALYGTTANGGTSGIGTVFKIRPDGTGFQTLYSFTGINDGGNPTTGLIQGADGGLYGTSQRPRSLGIVQGMGAVFYIKTDGSGFRTVYTFSASDLIGLFQGGTLGSIVQGKDGALYGTVQYVDTSYRNAGDVFKVNSDGSGFQMLHYFNSSSPSDGSGPNNIIQGQDGAFYGTNAFNGAFGSGTIFKVSSDGSSFQTIYGFGSASDGANPTSNLLQGKDGALYGTTTGDNTPGNGTVFKVNRDGTGFQVLHRFTGYGDGGRPFAGLIQGQDGALYGTNASGGGIFGGVAFKVNTDGSGFQVLHSFGYTGYAIDAPLMQGPDGVLYGTGTYGGDYDYGVVFKLNPDGTGFQVLYNFSGGDDQGEPRAALILGPDGALYGTTTGSDSFYDPDPDAGYGSVFKVNTDGSGFQTLYTFTKGSDGGYPYAALLLGQDGALYGTTVQGGTTGNGTLFKINSDGSGFQTLYNFTGSDDGGQSRATLIQTTDGKIYGATNIDTHGNGTVFQVNADGTGFQTLYTFAGSNDGANPYAGLIQSTDGGFYGTTFNAGSFGDGTVFRVGGQAVLGIHFPSSTVIGGTTTTATIQIAFATSTDTVVQLSSSKGTVASVPASVTVPAGQTSVSFPVVTAPPVNPASLPVTLTASLNGHSVTSTLTVTNPPAPVLRVSAVWSRTSSGIQVTLTASNTGTGTATAVKITGATLTDLTTNRANTGTPLPLQFGDVAPGVAKTLTLTFPASTGPSGDRGALRLSGSYGQGTLSSTIQHTLP